MKANLIDLSDLVNEVTCRAETESIVSLEKKIRFTRYVHLPTMENSLKCKGNRVYKILN